MALMITDECIMCGACLEVCPNNAISEGEDLISVINPNLCTECVGFEDSPQCVEVCAVEAIIQNPDYQETKEQLMLKKENLYAE